MSLIEKPEPVLSKTGKIRTMVFGFKFGFLRSKPKEISKECTCNECAQIGHEECGCCQ